MDQGKHQYIVEIQNKEDEAYIQRLQYYVAKAYSEHLKPSEKYLKLNPVTLLSVNNHILFQGIDGYLNFHNNIVTGTQIESFNDMSYVTLELPKFNKNW